MTDKITVEGDSLVIKDSMGGIIYQTGTTTPPVEPPIVPPSGNADIQVGPNHEFKTLKAGIEAADDGDVIEVDSGTYTNDFSTIGKRLTIRGVGSTKPKLVATQSPSNGKGILVVQKDVTVENLEFSGCKVADLNGAGIRYEGGNLTVKDCLFKDNQMGILASASGEGVIKITGTEFDHNGAPGSNAHNCYINQVAHVIVDNCYSHDNITGHQFKSRAKKTTITNSRFYDNEGGGNYNIDLPECGVVVIRGCTVQQKNNAGNVTMVAYGMEKGPEAGASLAVEGLTAVNDHTNATMVRNNTSVSAAINGAKVWGINNSQILSGPGKVSGTTQLASRPELP